MKKLKRSLYVAATGVMITATCSGGLAVARARQQYYGVCSILTGFPGILQQAGLLQGGTCASQIGQPLCSAGAACTVSGKAGKCKNTGQIGQPAICTCVANPTPSP